MGQGAPEIAVPHAGETLWRALYVRLVDEVVPLADLLSTHFGDDVVVGEAAAPAAMRILLMERSARREADERAAEVPGLRLRLAQTEDSATQAEAAWKAEHSLRLAAEKAREEADAYAGRANARIADLGERLDATEAVLRAAESRAARLAKALAPFADPERYNTAEEECRENKAMRWCAVHSFRWPCPVGPARAALAAEERK